MPSRKPARPPAYDAYNHDKALYDRVRKPDGGAYGSLDYEDDNGKAIGPLAFTQWTRGLRDVVNANAVYLDDVAGTANKAKAEVDALEARVKRLEDAPQARPFP